jgi:hypothetical protein
MSLNIRSLALAYIVALALTPGCSTQPISQVTTPTGRPPSDPMFQFVGLWEGSLAGFDGPDFFPGAGHEIVFRLFITPDAVHVFTQSEGEWKESKPGFFSQSQWASQMIISSITSGHDDEGVWVESSIFTLVHVDSDTLQAYWVRAVNNLDLPLDHPDHHFAWGSSGHLKRINAGGGV